MGLDFQIHNWKPEIRWRITISTHYWRSIDWEVSALFRHTQNHLGDFTSHDIPMVWVYHEISWYIPISMVDTGEYLIAPPLYPNSRYPRDVWGATDRNFRTTGHRSERSSLRAQQIWLTVLWNSSTWDFGHLQMGMLAMNQMVLDDHVRWFEMMFEMILDLYLRIIHHPSPMTCHKWLGSPTIRIWTQLSLTMVGLWHRWEWNLDSLSLASLEARTVHWPYCGSSAAQRFVRKSSAAQQRRCWACHTSDG